MRLREARIGALCTHTNVKMPKVLFLLEKKAPNIWEKTKILLNLCPNKINKC